MADINKVIEKCVNDIWDSYDDDGSGTLDKDECKQFVINTMKEAMGPEVVETFSDDDFDSAFSKVDLDGNGTIEKGEMVMFIRRVAGLSVGRI